MFGSGVEIRIKNDNTDVALQELSNAIQNALERIGEKAEEYARQSCPVDTGNLQSSLTHVVEEESVAVGTEVTYGKYVEVGTINMSAQPYLGPAIEDHVSEYKSILEEHLKAGG